MRISDWSSDVCSSDLNFVRIRLPDEGAGILVMLLYKAVDGGLEIYDGMKDAVFQPAPCELGEKALDGIEPCARRREEVEGQKRMPGQPGADIRLLVGRIIVKDDVDGLVRGLLGLGRVQGKNEFLL